MAHLVDHPGLPKVMERYQDTPDEIRAGLAVGFRGLGPSPAWLGWPRRPPGWFRSPEHIAAPAADLVPPEEGRPDGHTALGGDFIGLQAVELQHRVNVEQIGLQLVDLAAHIDNLTRYGRPLLAQT
jgi:hypothetical protein